MNDSPPVLHRKRSYHVKSKVCAYNTVAAKNVELVLQEGCAQGYEPIGIVLTPGQGPFCYTVSVFFKIECSGDGCSLCKEEFREGNFGHKLSW